MVKRENGMVLVAFTSQQMSKHEENYNIHDKELFAIINTLKKWNHHLFRVKVHVQTDYKGLEYCLSKKDLQGHQAQWVEICAHFNLHIQYKPGKVNVVADALT